MRRITQFFKDAWSLSAGPIRRADPLLMGAAIAYNGLFALVPLTLAFTAALTFLDRSDSVIGDLLLAIEENLPSTVGEFLGELVEESYQWVSDARGVILIVSILIALWSGSRAVYAVQKALRTAQGVEDDRGYVVARGLGIVVTIAAGVGVMIAYVVFLLGTRFWDELAGRLGIANGGLVRSFAVGLMIVLVWLILWAIYRWGPPEPMSYASVVAAGVAALIVLGTVIAMQIIPEFSSASTIALFGAIGVFLIWLYYCGIVIVAAPTVLAAIVGAARGQTSG